MIVKFRQMMYGGWNLTTEGYFNHRGHPTQELVTEQDLKDRVVEALEAGYQVEISN